MATDLLEVSPRFNLLYHPFWISKEFNRNQNFWKDDTYQTLSVITSIQEFLGITSLLRTAHMNAGYFYLMREGVFPTWEHASNASGGEWKIRISLDEGDDPVAAFQELGLQLLSWNLTANDTDAACINGICLAPNTDRQWVMKIWNNDSSKNSVSLLDPVVMQRWHAVDEEGRPKTRYTAFNDSREAQKAPVVRVAVPGRPAANPWRR